MKTTTDSNISTTTLKALTVLDFLGEQRNPVTVMEVAAGVGVDRATAYRMLMTLFQAGYVRRDAVLKNYRLSFKVLSLGQYILDDGERAGMIMECLRKISQETGETVHYAVLDDDVAVLLYRVKGTQRVAVDFHIGARSPLTVSSVGKVLLAFQDIRLTEAILARGMPRLTPHTITDPEVMRKELSTIRKQGYAYDDLEYAPDMRCLAVPVFENGGEVPGGISISGPSSRIDYEMLDQLRVVVQKHATELSRALGGLP